MNIGICGPILTEPFIEYLDGKSIAKFAKLPLGCGGASVNVLAKGLLERGHRISVFSFDFEIENAIMLEGPNLKIYLGPYRKRAKLRALDFFRTERKYLCGAIKREKPDLVHAHWTYEFALGALSSGIPTLVTIRDWAPAVLKYNFNFYRLIRLLMNNYVISRANHISANSIYIQKMVKETFGKEPAIIPNAIEDCFLRKDEKDRPALPVIISVSNGFSGLKNHENLIKALPLIQKEIPDCQLHLVGCDFEPSGKAEQWASRNNLNDGIVYKGDLNRKGVIDALDNASIMVHPSLEESFGNALIEAMSRRLPVVGGKNSGAVPWVLNYGKAGLLCDIRKSEEIASAAIELFRKQESWKRFSQTGYEYVVKNFSTSAACELCEAEYLKISPKLSTKELIYA